MCPEFCDLPLLSSISRWFHCRIIPLLRVFVFLLAPRLLPPVLAHSTPSLPFCHTLRLPAFLFFLPLSFVFFFSSRPPSVQMLSVFEPHSLHPRALFTRRPSGLPPHPSEFHLSRRGSWAFLYMRDRSWPLAPCFSESKNSSLKTFVPFVLFFRGTLPLLVLMSQRRQELELVRTARPSKLHRVGLARMFPRIFFFPLRLFFLLLHR